QGSRDSALRYCLFSGRYLGTASGRPLHPELFAQIQTPDVWVVHDILRPPLHEHLARIDDVGAVGQAERLADIVVGDQDADAAVGKVTHQLLDVADGDRINAGEGLVEQHVARPRRQGASDFDAAAL